MKTTNWTALGRTAEQGAEDARRALAATGTKIAAAMAEMRAAFTRR